MSADPVVGTFWGSRDDSLVFTLEGSETEWAVSPSDVTTLEVYEGRKGRFWKGAALGLVTVGTAVTVVCASDDSQGGGTFQNPDLCYQDMPFGEALVWGVFAGLAWGAPVGGIVGALIRYDKWAPADVPRTRPVVVVRPDGHVSVGFTIPVRR